MAKNPILSKEDYHQRIDGYERLRLAFFCYDMRGFNSDGSEKNMRYSKGFMKKRERYKLYAMSPYSFFLEEFKHTHCTDKKLLRHMSMGKKSKIHAGLGVCHAYVMLAIEIEFLVSCSLVLPVTEIYDEQFNFMGAVGQMVADSMNTEVYIDCYVPEKKTRILGKQFTEQALYYQHNIQFDSELVTKLESLPNWSNIVIIQDVVDSNIFIEVLTKKIKKIKKKCWIYVVGISYTKKSQGS